MAVTLGADDVLVLTALKEELDALLQVHAPMREPWVVNDGDLPQHVAVLDGRAGPIRVAAARVTKMGGIATATLATRLIEAVKPAGLAMCGVCVGHPEDTDLGDVVIAERTFQHDEGKIRGDGFRSLRGFLAPLALVIACNRPPAGGEAEPVREEPVTSEPTHKLSDAGAPASLLRLEVTGAPGETTVLVRASDERPPVVLARPLLEATSLPLPPGFYTFVLAAGPVDQTIQLYARPGASIRARWGAPRSLVVDGGTPIDRAAAEQVWAADVKQLVAAVGDWNGEGELPPAAHEIIAAQRARIAALGDSVDAHLFRLRHASYVAQLTGPADAWSVLAPIAPDSPAWAAYAPWLVELLWFLKDVPEATARFGEVRARVADMGLEAAFVAGDLLAAERSGVPDALARSYTAATRVEGPLIVGAPMPRFELRSVDGGQPIRSEALLGVPYVIEVWSTWCEPCIKAMPDLHALHKRLAADDPPRLRVVSAAIDNTRAPIEEFRRARWPMPWTNVWVPSGESLFSAWSITGVPYAVLVGADGRVLAAGPHISLDTLLGLPEGAATAHEGDDPRGR